MSRPLLLDLFCGAGGAAMGYHRAGFDVVGVDIDPQPHYPFEFHQADALGLGVQAIQDGLFDVIHASPPCQAFSQAAGIRKGDHPNLIPPIRRMLKAIGLPYVIENIPTSPLPSAVFLCGAAFDLPIVRHRLFETVPYILISRQCSALSAKATGHGPGFYPYASGSWEADWREHVLPVVWPWMTLKEAGQAIPPAYTQFIGEQLLQVLEGAA